MTKDNAKDYLPWVQALAEGKTNHSPHARGSMKPLYQPRFKEFRIPSETEPGKVYKVMISERGEACCECRDYENVSEPRYRCKHIKKAMKIHDQKAKAKKGALDRSLSPADEARYQEAKESPPFLPD